MFTYNVEYQGSILKVPVDVEEICAKRLKNNILRFFDTKISYKNIKIYFVENDEAYHLDDNELVDDSQKFILEING